MQPRYKSFRDYETAFIWGKYQDMITAEMRDFAARDGDMYTVLDVMVAKFGENSTEVNGCEDSFKQINIWHNYINQLDYETMRKHAETLLKTPIYRGGSAKTGSGLKKFPSPNTVLRKFAYLSSAINEMIKKGANIENHVARVIPWIRSLSKGASDGTTD